MCLFLFSSSFRLNCFFISFELNTHNEFSMVVESMMRLNIKLLIFHAHKALIFDQIQLELCFYYCIIKYSLVFIVYFLYYIYVIMYIFICFESSNTIYYENIKRNENTKANQHTDFRTKNTYFLIKSNIQILSFII